MTENFDALAKLVEPFPPDYVGKLPRVTCGDCSRSRGSCSNHQRKKCNECGAYVSERHIHLDYVGHADVTRRLLDTDPMWSWEPAATDEHGLPLLDTDDKDNPVGMWIKLTVCGVTRLGYGSCPSGQNDAVKVLIGDALRNAAMRFGVALDLWAKGDRADPAAENATAAGGTAARRRPQQQQQQQVRPSGPPSQATAEHRDLMAVARDRPEIVQTLRAAREAGADMAVVGQAAEARQKVLDSGPPRNKNGGLSRSRMSDEELAAEGAMTRQQAKEHNRLVKDVEASPQKAERSTSRDPDDPWTTAPVDGDDVFGGTGT